jgi:secreted trypsin-like serine protease
MIVGSGGNFCTGTVLSARVVLTAAHCVAPGADYKLFERGPGNAPQLRDIAQIVRHPQFDAGAYARQRVTADVALLKLATPLSANYVPAQLAPARRVEVGEQLLVAGYGLAVQSDGKTGGIARAAQLIVTGQPGSLQIRLYDPATRGARIGRGACTGDSGAPAFDAHGVIGVVSWANGPNGSPGCGGLTGVTPLLRYRDWVAAAARKLSGTGNR